MTNWPADAPLIAAPDLAARLASPALLLLDCRHDLARPAFGREAWQAGHIPGARFACMEQELASPKRPDTGRHPLPTPMDFAATLGRWGYTPDSWVVAYDQGSGAFAARLWWMLRARGHRRVQVLDGGFAAWLATNGPVETAAPAVTPTQVDARPFAGALSSAEVVASLAAGSITLVDARGADRFGGRNETIDPVAGHVPGALNHPYTGNLGADGRFLPAAELASRWAPELARAAGAPLVAMCGSGVTACHNLLALELAGHRDARLYVGSFSEWITDPARPVATGE